MTSKQQKSRATKKAAPATASETLPTAEVKPRVKAKAAVKLAKEKREAKPKDPDLVVFAIRLAEAERQAIHAAAGPARATRFIRAVAIAAAHGDVDAFKRALKEAEEGRAKAAKK